jgi:hypothetical protein
VLGTPAGADRIVEPFGRVVRVHRVGEVELSITVASPKSSFDGPGGASSKVMLTGSVHPPGTDTIT